MRSNALHLVSFFLLFPTAVALLIALGARDSFDYHLAFGVWLFFGVPSLALSAFLFWLGSPSHPPTESNQVSSVGNH